MLERPEEIDGSETVRFFIVRSLSLPRTAASMASQLHAWLSGKGACAARQLHATHTVQ